MHFIQLMAEMHQIILKCLLHSMLLIIAHYVHYLHDVHDVVNAHDAHDALDSSDAPNVNDKLMIPLHMMQLA